MQNIVYEHSDLDINEEYLIKNTRIVEYGNSISKKLDSEHSD